MVMVASPSAFLLLLLSSLFSSSSSITVLIILSLLLLVVVVVVVVVVVGVLRLRLRGLYPRSFTSTSGDEIGILPPGSVGLVPVLGETLKLVAAYKTEDPEPFIDERVRRYGSRIFTTHVFGERTVFSADPEFNRMVLGAEGRAFEVSYPSSITTLLGRHSLLLMKGGLHKRMHSLTLARFSSSSVLHQSLLPDIDRLVCLTLDSWEEGQTVRLLDQAKKITFELTLKQLISYDPGEWTEALRHQYLLLIDGFFSIPFPDFLFFTTYAKAIKARTKVAQALRGVVRQRKEERMREQQKEEEGDYNEISVSKRMRRKKDMLDELVGAEEGLTEEEMVDFLLALLVAGYETTSTIMTLAVKFLTETPTALSLLKKEQEQIKGKKAEEGQLLDWNDYRSMSFTQCVINETLRVANIISGIFRRAIMDIHFKGYTIPKGCKVFASFRAVHLDIHHYKDARTFNPWRWQQSNDTTGAGPSPGAGIFTPFGGGPRLCPGYELARLEISVFLHHLVTRFSWEVTEEDRLIFFPTTRTLKGYPIIVKRRKLYDIGLKS